MGILRNIIVDVTSNVVEEAVRDTAAVALGGIAAVTGVAINATEKAAEGVAVVAKGTAKGVSAAAKGTVKAAKVIGSGINKANESFKELTAPLAKKKIEKMNNECAELLLMQVVESKDSYSINFYTPDLELCLTLNETSKDSKYELKSINGDNIAYFARKRKLFAKYVTVKSIDCAKERIFDNKSTDDSKTKFMFNGEYRIVKNNIISDYEIFEGDQKIASIKSKPVSYVDYAIMIHDENRDMEAILTTISKIIF